VRGGPAAIYASDSTSIYNQITRQGTDQAEGAVRGTIGDTGLYRVDGYWAGPIADKTYAAVGGFYRYHDGYRDNGFPSDEGGQIRLNLRREVGNGEIRFNIKLFDDNNVFYLPIPLADPRNTSVSLNQYIDIFDGTLNSSQLQNAVFRYADADGTLQAENRDLSNGRSTKYVNTGFDIEQTILGFNLNNKFRYTKGDIDFDGLYSSTLPADATVFANSFRTAATTAFGPVSRFGYAIAGTNGASIYDPATESGLVVQGNYRNIQNDFESTLNDLQLTRDVNFLGEHKVLLGAYYAKYSTDLSWRANDYLMQVRGNPRLLDLIAYDAAGTALGSVTDDGVLRHSSTLFSGVSKIDHYALYASDTWNITDRLSLEAAVRQNEFDGEGYFRLTRPNNLGDATTLADNASLGFTGALLPRSFEYDNTAWTLGANYNFNDTVGVYARVSKSYIGPGEFNLILPFAATASGAEQYEAGFKFDSSDFALFATAFYTKFDPLAVSVFVQNQTTGELSFAPFTAEVTNPGIELDAFWQPTSNFSIRGVATYTDAQIGNLTNASGLQPFNADGNQPIRQPKYFGNIQPTYKFGLGEWDGEVYGTYNFVGKRFVDYANTTELPAYETIGAGVTIGNDAWSLQLVGDNLTNEEGLTEGNPRTDQLTGQGTTTAIYGRPIFGRNFRLVLTRSW
jgi:outer membrane receptor protein involved in Fe transport